MNWFGGILPAQTLSISSVCRLGAGWEVDQRFLKSTEQCPELVEYAQCCGVSSHQTGLRKKSTTSRIVIFIYRLPHRKAKEKKITINMTITRATERYTRLALDSSTFLMLNFLNAKKLTTRIPTRAKKAITNFPRNISVKTIAAPA